jgi:hypothetical protein
MEAAPPSPTSPRFFPATGATSIASRASAGLAPAGDESGGGGPSGARRRVGGGARAAYEAIAARLREPGLPRHELLRLAQLGQAVALVEMLANATDVEGRVDAAVQLARLASELPEDPPAPPKLSPAEEEREGARRFEAWAEAEADPPDADEAGAAAAGAAP